MGALSMSAEQRQAIAEAQGDVDEARRQLGEAEHRLHVAKRAAGVRTCQCGMTNDVPAERHEPGCECSDRPASDHALNFGRGRR